MNTTNGYNLALQRQLVDSKINDISDLKQKLEFSKIGSASDGMSVTSTVEECEKHGKYTSYEKYLTISGKRITSSKSECPQCLEEKIRKKEIEREQAEQRARQSKIEYLLNSLNIPERFKNCTLQNYEPVNDDAKRVLKVCQAYASKWPERLQKGGGLVMCGKPGTGKNHLALAIARHAIIEHQSSVIFTTALKIAREYKSTWSKAATRHKLYENDTGSEDGNGLPPHSVAVIVDGGDVTDIAQAIRGNKGQGTSTHGTTSVTVPDKYGNPHVIKFSRSSDVPVYARIKLKVFTGYTSQIGQQIQQAISDYINSLMIGDSVLLSRIYSPANLGVVSGGNARYYDIQELTIGKSPGALSSSNIDIRYNESASCTPENIVITVES